MTNLLLQGKATELRQRANTISHAMALLDNSELDLAPEAHRVALSDAPLPGVQGGTFCGHAIFSRDGKVLSVGVRQNAKNRVDLMIRAEGCTTRVTERRYFPEPSTVLTVTAVFGQAGDLISYEEIF